MSRKEEMEAMVDGWTQRETGVSVAKQILVFSPTNKLVVTIIVHYQYSC